MCEHRGALTPPTIVGAPAVVGGGRPMRCAERNGVAHLVVRSVGVAGRAAGAVCCQCWSCDDYTRVVAAARAVHEEQSRFRRSLARWALVVHGNGAPGPDLDLHDGKLGLDDGMPRAASRTHRPRWGALPADDTADLGGSTCANTAR